jgi:uncharacterized protein
MPRCPHCDKTVAPRAQNPSFPFCSSRCKGVDLSKWLGEEYRIGGSVTDKDPSTAQEATNPPAREPEGQ